VSIFSPWYIFRPGKIGRRLQAVFKQIPQGTVNDRLPFGPNIELDPTRTMGKALYFNGTHELSMAEVAYRLASGASLAVDVGANIGYVTLAIASALATDGRCHAFEPAPELYSQLRRNTGKELNPNLASRIVTHNVALSSSNGLATLSIPLSSNEGLATLNSVNGPFRSLEVETATLDSYLDFEKRIDLLKLDVEGHELSVLHGASKNLIKRNIRSIIFEDHLGPESPMIEFLAAMEFIIFMIDHSTFRPRLIPRGQVLHTPVNAACNWLAVLDAEDSVCRITRFGWRVLGW
jgi:FkbM family methyltransferase